MKTKQCIRCGETKPETEFHYRSVQHAQRQRHCKKCNELRRISLQGRGCRDQLAQIGLEITALFPGDLAEGVRNGQVIADVTCRLLRELARNVVAA